MLRRDVAIRPALGAAMLNREVATCGAAMLRREVAMRPARGAAILSRDVATCGAAILNREVAIRPARGAAMLKRAVATCGAAMLRREVAIKPAAGRAADMALNGAARPARGAPTLILEVAIKEVAGRAADIALSGAAKPARALNGAANLLGAVKLARALSGAASRVNCRVGAIDRPAWDVAISVEEGRPSAARPATTEVAMRLGAANLNLSIPKSTPPYTLWILAPLSRSPETIPESCTQIFERHRSFHN